MIGTNRAKYFFFIKSIILSFVISISIVEAKTLNWSKYNYSHFSNKEPLKMLLEALAADQNTPIIVSDSVTEVVSVYYRERKLENILNELKTVYGLVTYYDGDILYIYKSNEIVSSKVTLKKVPIRLLEQELKQVGIFDKKMKWVVSNNDTVVFSGPERFVESVLSIAKEIDELKSSLIYVYKDDGIKNYSNIFPKGDNIVILEIIKTNGSNKIGKESTDLAESSTTIINNAAIDKENLVEQ